MPKFTVGSFLIFISLASVLLALNTVPFRAPYSIHIYDGRSYDLLADYYGWPWIYRYKITDQDVPEEIILDAEDDFFGLRFHLIDNFFICFAFALVGTCLMIPLVRWLRTKRVSDAVTKPDELKD